MVYSPRSTARHNFGLLPDLRAMAGMGLAYRHQSYRFDELSDYAHSAVARYFLAGMIVPALIIIAGQLMPIVAVPMVAAAITTLWVIVLGINRTSTGRKIFYAFTIPLLSLLLIKMLAVLFTYRIAGAAIGAIASLYLVPRYSKGPFDFYLQWLYTHPRLKPQTRQTVPAVPGIDRALLLLLLAIVVVIPVVSTTVAIALLYVLPLLLLRKAGLRPRNLIEAGIRVLAPYVTYGGVEAYAPGVWHPPVPQRRRKDAMLWLLAPFFFTLAAGLTIFMPLSDFIVKFPALGMPASDSAQVHWSSIALEQPVWWVAYTIAQVFSHDHTAYLWTFPIAVAIAITLPPLLLVAVFRAPLTHAVEETRKVEGTRDETGTLRGGLDEDGRVEWQWYLDRMTTSSHAAAGPFGDTIREAEHLFVGVEPHARFPVLLDTKLLSEHMYIVGDSGSGKTSLGLMPLLIQLIRGHTRPDGKPSDSPPIVVFDLKGDPALFNTVKKEAEDRGAEFRFFTPEFDKASHYFNPFASLDSKYRTEIQLCNLVMDALSLNHGEGYGRGYYGRQSRSMLLAAMKTDEKPDGQKSKRAKPLSLADLKAKLLELRTEHPQEFKDTAELLSTVEALCTYKNLSIATSEKDLSATIHMPSVLERRQVVYFYLPAAVESVSVREIAKLGLYSLLTACIDRQRSHPADEQRQAYVIIDEFQRIAGENFKVILEQARSFGLGVVLANQSVADLKTADVDLRPTVRTNTRVKRFFSLSDPQDIASMSEASGEELAYMRTWNQIAGQSPYTELAAQAYNSRSDTQSLKARLTTNDIMAVSDHPLDSILQISRGNGYTQFAGLPHIVRSTWPMLFKDYKDLANTPWPDREVYDEGTLTRNDKSPVDREAERDEEIARLNFAKLQSVLSREG